MPQAFDKSGLVPRNRRELAISLSLLVGAVALIGGLQALTSGWLASPEEDAPDAVFRAQDPPLARLFSRALLAARAYQLSRDALPQDAADLVWQWDAEGEPYFRRPPLDPWGYEIELWRTGEPSMPLILISRGADGRRGGRGENADIDSSQVLDGALIELHRALGDGAAQ